MSTPAPAITPAIARCRAEQRAALDLAAAQGIAIADDPQLYLWLNDWFAEEVLRGDG